MEKIKLYCPIKGCGWCLKIPKDTPEVPIMEYICYGDEFQKHLTQNHTFEEIASAIYSFAISRIET